MKKLIVFLFALLFISQSIYGENLRLDSDEDDPSFVSDSDEDDLSLSDEDALAIAEKRRHHGHNDRPGLPLSKTAATLGPLADLAGTWVGNGFVLTALPNFSSKAPSTGPGPFRLLLNATNELLEFTPIGGPIPNRGVISCFGSKTGQPDISLFGLTYLQRIWDLETNEPLHIEPGIFVYVPPTTVFPKEPKATVVRLATIPHGDAVLAQSTKIFTIKGPPKFDVVSSLPFKAEEGDDDPCIPPITPEYLLPYTNPTNLPPDIPASYVLNPNQFLSDAIQGQDIISTTVVMITTDFPDNDPPVGGILNIPFVTLNANADELDAIFFIETVRQPDGSTFLQLQYSQKVGMDFLGIDWPHIQVATLVKQ